jgi:hypothetical protein
LGLYRKTYGFAHRLLFLVSYIKYRLVAEWWRAGTAAEKYHLRRLDASASSLERLALRPAIATTTMSTVYLHGDGKNGLFMRLRAGI